MSDELLPCPFCGVIPTRVATELFEGEVYKIDHKPKCYLEHIGCYAMGERTTKAWNTRPDSKPEKDCKSSCKLFAEAQLKEAFWKERCKICKEEAVISGKPYKYATYMRAYEVDTSFFEGSFEAGFNAARERKE